MRYYEITITPQNGSPIVYTSLTNSGGNNGSALKVFFDIYSQKYHETQMNSIVRIWGIPYTDISQIANLNPNSYGQNAPIIEVKLGMSKGLPFANPNLAGLVVKGSILQSFANWQGTEITLDIVFTSYLGSPNLLTQNIPFNWEQGNLLQNAITNSLNAAFPGITVNNEISTELKFTETQPGWYENLVQFNQFINNISKQANQDPDYQGVSILVSNGEFVLSDGSQESPKVNSNIKFTDIIGNLTWLNIATIQAKLVLRSDITVGDYVVFPKGSPITNSINNFSQNRNNVSFQGIFLVNKVRHNGNSRQADANSWCTIIDCVIPNPLPSGIELPA
jgi:hypothetical protein